MVAAHNRCERGQNWDSEVGWKRPRMSDRLMCVVRREVYDEGRKGTQRHDENDLEYA